MSTTDARTDEREAADDEGEAAKHETADAAARLRELPPSAKLVYKVLEYDGSLTQGEITEATLLPARTVRYALTRLEEADLVSSRFSFTDARKRIYTLGAERSTPPLAEAP